MKKRMLAMVFATVLACGIAGCGEKEEEHAGHDHAQEQEATDEVSAYLQSLPEEISVDSAMAEGFYTINDGVTGNQEVWDAFMAKMEQGEEAEVVVCQYTTKGGSVLDHVTYHADGSITVVSDTTRDGYEDEKSTLKAPETYTDLKVFENFSLQEGGTAYTVCVLSDNPELTADDFRTHWVNMTADENHIYMLYVI